MNEVEVVEIAREAIWVMLKIGAPVMLVALAVGLIISLFQALTQIQEVTLTFVPKIVAIFLALTVLLPYMLATLIGFSHHLFDMIGSVD
jgi:flagellar biosynthetic protein FliQ